MEKEQSKVNRKLIKKRLNCDKETGKVVSIIKTYKEKTLNKSYDRFDLYDYYKILVRVDAETGEEVTLKRELVYRSCDNR